MLLLQTCVLLGPAKIAAPLPVASYRALSRSLSRNRTQAFVLLASRRSSRRRVAIVGPRGLLGPGFEAPDRLISLNVSPSRRSLAFVMSNGSRPETLLVTTGGERRLETSLPDLYSVVWDPAGRLIAFGSDQTARVVYRESVPKRAAAPTRSDLRAYDLCPLPRPSPGRAFLSAAPVPFLIETTSGKGPPKRTGTLLFVGTDLRVSRRLPVDVPGPFGIKASSDGGSIAFLDMDGRLSLMDLASGRRTTLSRHPAFAYGWARGTRALAFGQEEPRERRSLVIRDVAGRARRIDLGRRDAMSLAWGDASTICVVTSRDDRSELLLVGPNGSLRKLPTGRGWSPMYVCDSP